jgi:hypothetical protein
MIERIWHLRDYIIKLENTKDDIIHHLNSLKKLDNLNKNLWISDVKEFYYNIVSACKMLRTLHYNAREEYDDGFYDCTYDECPNGHIRMIDD